MRGRPDLRARGPAGRAASAAPWACPPRRRGGDGAAWEASWERPPAGLPPAGGGDAFRHLPTVAVARLLLLLLALPASASAQPWGVTASTAVESVGDRGTWLESRLAVGGRAGGLAGLAEAGVVERYGQAAAFVGADLYPTLADGAYANVRARWAPGSDVTARLDLAAEAFVALGGGWEGSAGARRLAFADRAVVAASASGARYAGPWYVRGQVSAVPDGGRVPVSARLLVRRLDGDEGGAFGSFWEVSVGRGEEAVVEAAGQSAVRGSWSVAGRLQRPLAGPVGLSLGAGYTADGDLSRAAAEAGLSVRW